MFYGGISIVLGVIGLLILLLGLRMLFRRGWVLGWVRGMSGVCFIGLAVVIALVAIDLRSYHQLNTDKPIATLSFEQLGSQRYLASLTLTEGGPSREFELAGDQWQLDARIVRWTGWFRLIGGKPGYRLDRISGRYLSLQDERLRERSVHALESKEFGVDLWAFAHKNRDYTPWLDAAYGSATFVPMADGALFEVALSSSGLVAKPLNTAAKQAVYYWQ